MDSFKENANDILEFIRWLAHLIIIWCQHMFVSMKFSCATAGFKLAFCKRQAAMIDVQLGTSFFEAFWTDVSVIFTFSSIVRAAKKAVIIYPVDVHVLNVVPAGHRRKKSLTGTDARDLSSYLRRYVSHYSVNCQKQNI